MWRFRSLAGACTFRLSASRTALPTFARRLHSTVIPTSDSRAKVAIVRLLQTCCVSEKEVAQYLRLYSSVSSSQFAVIKAGGGVIEHELDDLVSSLSFLKDVGLCPIVVHGAGPQLNEALSREKIPVGFKDGQRITSASVLSVARKVFLDANMRLVDALGKKGVSARSIVAGVFSAEKAADGALGLVGDSVSVDTSAVFDAIRKGHLPILTSMAMSSEGQQLNVNADVAAAALAVSVKPLKTVFISAKGGLVDQNQSILTNIDIDIDYDRLMAQPWFKHGDRLKLKQIKNLIDKLPETSSVAITSAKLLSQELFTHKGSGTLLRKRERIDRFSDFSSVDVERLQEMLQRSFQADMLPMFFESESSKVESVFVSELYRAAAVVSALPSGKVSYLSKFAVDTEAQSAGLGQQLWSRLVEEHPKLIWRSRSNNPINPWYFSRADGSVRDGYWTVFWCGIPSEQGIALVEEVVTLPPTFQSKSSPRTVNGPCLFVDGASGTRKTKIAVIGARGHTGSELLHMIGQHSQLELALASSRSFKGRKVSEVAAIQSPLEFVDASPLDLAVRDDIGVWVLALPNGVAADYSNTILNRMPEAKILDLSADFRFDSSFVYGLPERKHQRQKLKGASLVSNPGCYATAAQLALLPLLDMDKSFCGIPHVFGVSGYSGAGSTPCRNNDVNILHDNLIPYKQVGHIHEKEIGFQLGVPVGFSPNVASWFRGIACTVSCQLHPGHSLEDLVQAFREYYDGEQFVRVCAEAEIPEVRDIRESPNAAIGGFAYDDEHRRVVVNSTLDNLLKGAASQAMQNINLMFDFEECDGIVSSKAPLEKSPEPTLSV